MSQFDQFATESRKHALPEFLIVVAILAAIVALS